MKMKVNLVLYITIQKYAMLQLSPLSQLLLSYVIKFIFYP